jgi:hypothetical protein
MGRCRSTPLVRTSPVSTREAGGGHDRQPGGPLGHHWTARQSHPTRGCPGLGPQAGRRGQTGARRPRPRHCPRAAAAAPQRRVGRRAARGGGIRNSAACERSAPHEAHRRTGAAGHPGHPRRGTGMTISVRRCTSLRAASHDGLSGVYGEVAPPEVGPQAVGRAAARRHAGSRSSSHDRQPVWVDDPSRFGERQGQSGAPRRCDRAWSEGGHRIRIPPQASADHVLAQWCDVGACVVTPACACVRSAACLRSWSADP